MFLRRATRHINRHTLYVRNLPCQHLCLQKKRKQRCHLRPNQLHLTATHLLPCLSVRLGVVTLGVTSDKVDFKFLLLVLFFSRLKRETQTFPNRVFLTNMFFRSSDGQLRDGVFKRSQVPHDQTPVLPRGGDFGNGRVASDDAHAGHRVLVDGGEFGRDLINLPLVHHGLEHLPGVHLGSSG